MRFWTAYIFGSYLIALLLLIGGYVWIAGECFLIGSVGWFIRYKMKPYE